MNQKVTFHQMIPFVLLLLFLGIVALFVLNLSNTNTIQIIPGVSNNQVAANAFDYEKAADVSAQRWQAMGEFYKAKGLLTRDDFDYEQAADVMAYRWQAMARAYEKQGLLNYSNNADDLMAYRWQAMGEAYEKMGLLNER